jgi:hypothetical protein
MPIDAPTAPRRRTLTRLLITFVGAVLVLTVALVVGFWPRDAHELTSVADQLTVPSTWSVVADRAEPRRLICLGDSPCPSLNRTWAVGTNLTGAQFAALVRGTGWNLSVDPDCALRPNTYGRQKACSATGVADGYSAEITLFGSVADPSATTVSLTLRPAR